MAEGFEEYLLAIVSSSMIIYRTSFYTGIVGKAGRNGTGFLVFSYLQQIRWWLGTSEGCSHKRAPVLK
jgi:hypothetical protein